MKLVMSKGPLQQLQMHERCNDEGGICKWHYLVIMTDEALSILKIIVVIHVMS